jgi:hypothetical protein
MNIRPNREDNDHVCFAAYRSFVPIANCFVLEAILPADPHPRDRGNGGEATLGRNFKSGNAFAGDSRTPDRHTHNGKVN